MSSKGAKQPMRTWSLRTTELFYESFDQCNVYALHSLSSSIAEGDADDDIESGDGVCAVSLSGRCRYVTVVDQPPEQTPLGFALRRRTLTLPTIADDPALVEVVSSAVMSIGEAHHLIAYAFVVDKPQAMRSAGT